MSPSAPAQALRTGTPQCSQMSAATIAQAGAAERNGACGKPPLATSEVGEAVEAVGVAVTLLYTRPNERTRGAYHHMFQRVSRGWVNRGPISNTSHIGQYSRAT
eukprot:scaffold31013_cov110-Isochrysis_galbana.AAC.1